MAAAYIVWAYKDVTDGMRDRCFVPSLPVCFLQDIRNNRIRLFSYAGREGSTLPAFSFYRAKIHMAALIPLTAANRTVIHKIVVAADRL